MEIQVKISPYSSSLQYYSVLWRRKRKINIFTPWRRMVRVWEGFDLVPDQPMLFSRFEDAEAYAKELKKDPSLIEKHYEEQAQIYSELKEQREKYRKERNISRVL